MWNNPECSQLYQLMWQPGHHLHHDWWDTFNLKKWQSYYSKLSTEAQRGINRLICQQRLAMPLSSNMLEWHVIEFRLSTFDVVELTQIQRRLLFSVPRLNILLTGLGLMVMECPDYLLVRAYRSALLQVFTLQQLEQLCGLWRIGGKAPSFSPEHIIIAAYQTGYQLFSAEMKADLVWQLLIYTLPKALPIEEYIALIQPVNSSDADINNPYPIKPNTAGCNICQLFIRLERFL